MRIAAFLDILTLIFQGFRNAVVREDKAISNPLPHRCEGE